MDKFAAIWMQNLKSMIAGISDAINSDHLLDIFHASARDDGDIDVRVVGESLKDGTCLGRQRGQVWMWCDRGQGTIVVEE